MEMRHRLSSIRLLGVVLALATIAGTAQASTTYLGLLSPGDYSFTDYVRPDRTFHNFVRFRLDDSAQVSSFMESLQLSFSSFDLLGIDNFSASLQKLGSGGFQTVHSLTTGNPISFDDLLGSGRYRIALSGTSTGIFGGLYKGALHVAAVPEADTWVMLLAGLGIVLYQLRRKQRALGLQPLAA